MLAVGLEACVGVSLHPPRPDLTSRSTPRLAVSHMSSRKVTSALFKRTGPWGRCGVGVFPGCVRDADLYGVKHTSSVSEYTYDRTLWGQVGAKAVANRVRAAAEG